MDGIELIATAGRPKGSMSLLHKFGSNLFTGDTLALSGSTGRLSGFPRYNRGGWPLQVKTIEKLAAEPFHNIYPGHGRIARFENDGQRRRQILEVVREWDGSR